jgi:outer membrane protein assembly factor BamD (BamD/ComL family)
MLIQESRTYKLAKAALLAVLLVVTPVTGYLHAQTKKPAAAAEKQEDPLSILFKSAEKALEEKKYKDALALFEELETKAVDVETKLKASSPSVSPSASSSSRTGREPKRS